MEEHVAAAKATLDLEQSQLHAWPQLLEAYCALLCLRVAGSNVVLSQLDACLCVVDVAVRQGVLAQDKVAHVVEARKVGDGRRRELLDGLAHTDGGGEDEEMPYFDAV